MEIKFEDQSTAQITYVSALTQQDLDKNAVIHQGHNYVKVGKSYKKLDSVLSRVIKLIGLIALGILIIPFFFSGYHRTIKQLYKEISSKQEKVIHYIPSKATPFAQHNRVKKVADALNDTLDNIKRPHIQIQQAKCFVAIQFDNERIRKEFIIKPDNNQSFTTDFFKENVNKIRAHLDDYVDHHDLGICHKMDCLTLFKDDNNQFHQVSKDFNQENDMPTTGGTSINIGLGQQGLSAMIHTLTDEMGFPKEKQVSNGDFIPGTYYQDLDAIKNADEQDLDDIAVKEEL